MPDAGDRGRPAPTQNVRDRIFVATREAIVTRQLQPGAKLTEDVIAATFGCGRGPVRWAAHDRTTAPCDPSPGQPGSPSPGPAGRDSSGRPRKHPSTWLVGTGL